MNKILVVDDEPVVCDALSEFLEGKGYQVMIAHSGDEALAAYKRERPDLVSLDIQMPGKDGFETLEELKAFDSGVKAIIVSAINEESSFKKAKSLGAFYITKPVNLNYLELAVATKLGQRLPTIMP